MAGTDGCGVRWERREVRSYSGSFRGSAKVYLPGAEDDVACLLRAAGAADPPARVTVRGGGNALHSHAIGEIVMSTEHFAAVRHLDAARQVIRVGGGTPWEAILAAASAAGCVPAVAVSTGRATAGGTVATDGLSRFSPLTFKEAESIHSLRVVFPAEVEGRQAWRLHHPRCFGHWLDGEAPDDALPPEKKALNDRLFRAVVGGLGLLGVVTEVTYHLLRAPAGDQPLRVATRIETWRGFGRLVEELDGAVAEIGALRLEALGAEDLDDARPACAARLPRSAGEGYAALYGAASFMRPGWKRVERGARIVSRYTREPGGEGFFWYDRRTHWQGISRALWLLPLGSNPVGLWGDVEKARSTRERPRDYINDLEDFTFFMEGHTLAKEHLERQGSPLSAIQQTFVLPAASRGGAPSPAATFLSLAQGLTSRDEVHPTVVDVLYLPGDDVLLSASHGLPGYAVTLAFEGQPREVARERIRELMHLLSAECLKAGGRVSLTKDLYLEPETLGAMYRGLLPAFLEVKEWVDPRGVLSSWLYERILLPAAAHAGEAAAAGG